MDYYSALQKSGKILESYFEQSKDILHGGSKGTITMKHNLPGSQKSADYPYQTKKG